MLRHFMLQSINSRSREIFGYEALFRAGSRAEFRCNPDAASLVMTDNWLLYDLEELAGGYPVFLNCTRETLMSGFITLLPQSAVIEVHGSTLDRAVLSACRRLKAQGYRFALDDFRSLQGVEAFLELADFIKIDFQLFTGQERVNLFATLRRTGATLIGKMIETPEELAAALEEGCDLVQGYHLASLLSFAKDRDRVNPLRCLGLLERLAGHDCTLGEIAYWVARDSGLEARILRRARWIAKGSHVASIHDALELVGKSGVRRLLMLAMSATLEHRFQAEPILAESA